MEIKKRTILRTLELRNQHAALLHFFRFFPIFSEIFRFFPKFSNFQAKRVKNSRMQEAMILKYDKKVFLKKRV